MFNIITGEQYRNGIMTAISTIADLIRPTYGGGGTNIVVESTLRPGHILANDAQTIIQPIKSEDPLSRVGLGFLKEVCDRTDKMSGDNRKTTILLTEEILKRSLKVEQNKNQLKKELHSLIPILEKSIDDRTTNISVDQIASVASTAAESEEIGKLLQEIYEKIGANGIIHPEASGTFETSYKIIEGIRFDMTGYLSPAMVHDEQAIKDNQKETKAIYENPLILVTKKKITTDDDINPLLREMLNEGKKDLVIFTQDMDSGVATMLVDLHKSKRFNILIIKAPTLWRDYIFEDFAQCVGATSIEDCTGKTFKNMTMKDLGTCGKIIVDEEETIILGHKDISDHIKKLELKGDNDSKLRLSWLCNKTAILKIGANSETDISYKRLKTHDAIRSSQLALKHGIIEGGGLTLSKIADDYPPNDTASTIIYDSLKSLRKQIIDNIGHEFVPSDIVDSAQTVKNAIRNAIGIASAIITAGGLVYLPKEKEQDKLKSPFND